MGSIKPSSCAATPKGIPHIQGWLPDMAVFLEVPEEFIPKVAFASSYSPPSHTFSSPTGPTQILPPAGIC